jgi:hypothetical protein
LGESQKQFFVVFFDAERLLKGKQGQMILAHFQEAIALVDQILKQICHASGRKYIKIVDNLDQVTGVLELLYKVDF